MTWLQEKESEQTTNYYIEKVVTKEQRYEVLKRQKWKCTFCFQTLKYSNKSKWEGEVAHIDHIHPYSKRNSYIN